MNRKLLLIATGLVAISAAFILCAAEPAPKSPGPVYSIREFELKSGVNAAQFDAFVRKELANAVGPDTEGMKLRILKGDRGERKGRYLFIWEFDSVATRNRYFPREGGGSSPAFQSAMDHMKIVFNKFSNFVNEHLAYTDYVQVSD